MPTGNLSARRSRGVRIVVVRRADLQRSAGWKPLSVCFAVTTLGWQLTYSGHPDQLLVAEDRESPELEDW